MDKNIFAVRRKNYIALGEIFFWTATINSWYHLLKEDRFKNILIGSLQELSQRGKIDVFAFVIMPNHIHLLWKISDGFERKDFQGALFSFTAHEFKR